MIQSKSLALYELVNQRCYAGSWTIDTSRIFLFLTHREKTKLNPLAPTRVIRSQKAEQTFGNTWERSRTNVRGEVPSFAKIPGGAYFRALKC